MYISLRHAAGRNLGWIVALWAAGCATTNDQIGPGRGVSLPGLSPAKLREAPASVPSLRGLDRRHFPVIAVVVPGREVEHWPTYVTPAAVAGTAPRQRGAFPTASSALDVGGSAGDQLLENDLDIAVAAVGLLRLPWEVLVETRLPWQVERSPSAAYARRPPAAAGVPWRWIVPPPPVGEVPGTVARNGAVSEGDPQP
ncbi:MAG: hypothetical protein IH804_06300 [Planctomycetes bacterium]|nr:hypothetical protein [Planctomycetota bacterium]